MESLDLSKLLNYIDKLHTDLREAMITKVEDKFKSQETKYQSDSTELLAADFSKAQGEFEVAGLNKVNPYFKNNYADLKAIVMAARPALAKHGLSFTQNIISYPNGETMLHTILRHKSGQWTESRIRSTPPKNDIQSISSYNTYLKRMALASLLGIVTGDEDDDAEAAVATTRETFAKGTALNHKYDPRNNNPEVITPEQLEELEYELADIPEFTRDVLEGLRIQSLADMPKVKYMASLQRIRQVKNTRLGIKTGHE